jgi:monothiol glutaredoxin
VLADQEIREGIKAYGDWPTIPQLYIDGELVGGSDIVLQMAASGELSSVLGLAAPDRTPPSITVTPAAVEMLKGALADAPGAALQLSIDAGFQPNFQLAPHDEGAIAAESNGLRVQFDLASARRANGITIDWVDDIRGKGLAIDNPNAPKPVQEISVRDADDLVRPATSPWWTCARPTSAPSPPWACRSRPSTATAAPRWKPCPRTPRWPSCATTVAAARRPPSSSALGFTKVFNVTGGINAWSEDVDNGVPKY